MQAYRAARFSGCLPVGKQMFERRRARLVRQKKLKEFPRLYDALVFLIVGLVAGALGLVGLAGVASQIAWILFLIGVVLLVVQLLRGRTPPVA